METQTPAVRVPDGAKRPRELAPGEVMRDKAGFWWLRPPAPGYLQHLNAASHPVLEGRRLTVSGVIVQRTGAWRLEDDAWIGGAR